MESCKNSEERNMKSDLVVQDFTMNVASQSDDMVFKVMDEDTTSDDFVWTSTNDIVRLGWELSKYLLFALMEE